MILPDANILLYAYNSDAAQHRKAKQWLESSLAVAEPLLFSWFTIMAFLRIATSPRLFPQPQNIGTASSIVGEWLARPNVSIISPTPGHWPILSRLLETAQATGPLVMDAHLAALAIEHGATLATADQDFKRFDGLKMFNPLLD